MHQSACEKEKEGEIKRPFVVRVWTDWEGAVGAFETNICRRWGEIG